METGRKGFPVTPIWLALGDLYSAGVGAGDLLENRRDPGCNCLTTSTGSYPKRLEARYEALQQDLEFLSCTGDVIGNINDAGSHGRATQLNLMQGIRKESYRMATLSIGGKSKTSIDTSHVPSLLVVGGVSPDGRYMMGNFEDAAGLQHAYGPGLRVRSVDADESFWNFNDGYYYA